LVGIGFNLNYRYLDNYAVLNHQEAASASYIAAVLYFLFIVGCGGRALQLRYKRGGNEKFAFDTSSD